MRLGEFIAENIEPILAEWETFARSLKPGATMERLALRNDAEWILRATVRDMAAKQTGEQRTSKSKGHGGAGGDASERLDEASATHGVGRVGFNLAEVVSEYRALRASVLRLWRASNPDPDAEDIDDVTRFNESIDQSLGKAVLAYMTRIDQARRMFLGVLGHDLRNPLNSISLCAAAAMQGGSADPDAPWALSQIEPSVQAIAGLIKDLIDFAYTGLGAAMPLAPVPMNLYLLCAEVVAEMRLAHPRRRFACRREGDVRIVADAARLRQVVSNLLGNAVQHGPADEPVMVSVVDGGDEVVLTTHNGGTAIPAELLPTIFDPLVRGSAENQHRRPGSVGLGLYIVREIAVAHGGSVGVSSSESDGTRFTVRLPRNGPSTPTRGGDSGG